MRGVSKVCAVVCVTFSLLFFVSGALAQGGSGGLTGRVTDASGAVVVGAHVTLTNTATHLVTTTVTSSAGIYSFTALPVVGTYDLKIEDPGFRVFQFSGIVISVGRTIQQDAQLQVGAATQTVTVQATAQLVQPTESQVSALVSPIDWQKMPLETRSQNTFIDLLPGVTPQDFTGSNRGASVDGARTGTGNFMVGGFDNNEQGQGGRGVFVGPGGANTTISPDAIQEYRVITHTPSAQYGQAGGFITDTVLKSGTNAWHGSLFEYNRVQALAANSFFSNRAGIHDSLVRNQFGGSVGGPIVKNKTFFYFTTEFHRLRTSSPLTTTGTTQSFLDFVNSGQFETFMESAPGGLCNRLFGASCPGAFASNNKLGPIFSKLASTQPFPLAKDSSTFSHTAQGLITGDLLGLMPSSVTCDGLATTAICYPVPVYGQVTAGDATSTNQARYDVKIDHTISDNDRLHGVFLYDNADTVDSIGGADTTIGPPFLDHGRAMNAGIDWDHMFSPTILNQFRIGYVRHTLNFPADPSAAGIPSVVTAFDPLGVGFGNSSSLPQFFTENMFQYKDDVSVTKGAHNFRFGGEYDRTRNGSAFEALRNGLFLPYGIEDLTTDMTFGDNADTAIFGGPVLGSWYYAEAAVNPVTAKLPVFYRGFRANQVGLYVQDNWRMAATFTLNIGLRWDYFGPPHNFRPNLDSNYYPGVPTTPIQTTSTNQFFPVNNPVYAAFSTGSFQIRNNGIWEKDTDNWSPRIGFAWDTMGDQKFIVRGGYGIGYNRMYNNIYENIRFNPPYFCFCSFGFFDTGVPGGGQETPGIYTVPFTSTSAFVDPNILPVLPKGSPRQMDGHLETAYYQNFTLSTQWAFANGWMWENDYIRTLGRKLLGLLDLNTFNGRTVTGFDNTRINPNLSTDDVRTNFAKSDYDAFQTGVRKTFSGGFMLNASYTFSKALDDLSDVFLNKMGTFPEDNMNPIIDWGPSDFNHQQRFVASLYYQLPFLKSNRILGGWGVSSIISLQSGSTFSVVDSGYDINHDGHFGDRVSYSGSGPITNAILGHGSPANGYFDPSMFQDTTCPASVNGGLWCNGGTGRNALTGPGFKNVDFGVSKQFSITEHVSMTFIGNFFNLFNHPNFGIPDSNISDLGSVGRSRSTQDPRITQLALRLDF